MKKSLISLLIFSVAVINNGCDRIDHEQIEETTKEPISYNIFGEAEFDTVVTGYLEAMETESFDGTITSAYFVITDFEDEGFRDSLLEGIERGNTVNRYENEAYLFNLGCLEDNNTITGSNFGEEDPYLDDETEEAIIASTAEEPITLTLHFGYHLGSGCTCCNLAHNIRLAEA